MNLLSYLRTQVRANRLANFRLHHSMSALSDAEYRAQRTAFFPSLAATLEHILVVDIYYLDCMHGDAEARTKALAWTPPTSLAALVDEQLRSDRRLVALLDRADDSTLERIVELPRATHVQREPLANVLAHLLNHQVHHRGQVHAMLSGSSVQPPQLDEFLMSSEAHLRADDMAALGWSEADLFPSRAASESSPRSRAGT